MTNSITTQKRKAAMSLAHKLWTKGRFNKDWGKCQSYAWYVVRLKFRMKNQVVKVSFFSIKEGKHIDRIATLKSEYLPEFKGTRKTKKKSSSTKVTFWDVQKNGFRSFLAENLSSYSIVKEAVVATLKDVSIAA